MSIFGQAINIYEVGGDRIWTPYTVSVFTDVAGVQTACTLGSATTDARFSVLNNSLVLIDVKFDVTAVPVGGTNLYFNVPFEPIEQVFASGASFYAPIFVGQNVDSDYLIYAKRLNIRNAPIVNSGFEIHKYDGTLESSVATYGIHGHYIRQ